MTEVRAAAEERRAAKLVWRPATVIAVEPRTPAIKSFFFATPGLAPFVAGQHMDVRLTAPDGYEAQRSYSIVSPPEHPATVELAIERLEDGEVSTFLHDEVRVGDEIELRGPVGGHFMWHVKNGGPILLIGGGSGIAPLVSMVRHHAAQDSSIPVTLVASARTVADLLFLEELRSRHAAGGSFALITAVTREAPAHPDLHGGRITRELIRRTLHARGVPAHAFVCGSNAFVEPVTQLLLELDVPAQRIRTERYGGQTPPAKEGK